MAAGRAIHSVVIEIPGRPGTGTGDHPENTRQEAEAVTQFQETASVRTLGNADRKYTAPFLAITAGLVAVLMAIAVISFAVTPRPSDATIGANTDTRAVDGYLAGLAAANHPLRIESAQRLADQWAAAALGSRLESLTDGWEAAQIRHGQAMRDFVKRGPTAE